MSFKNRGLEGDNETVCGCPRGTGRDGIFIGQCNLGMHKEYYSLLLEQIPGWRGICISSSFSVAIH